MKKIIVYLDKHFPFFHNKKSITLADEYVLREEEDARTHLKKVLSLGKNVHCEEGFKIYNGHKNVIIGDNVYLADTLINAGDGRGKVIIDNNVFCGHRVLILARGHNYHKFGVERQSSIIEKPIHIKTGSWIGSGAIILPGVIIGENSVVGAGSIVTKNVPPYTIVAGNPSKIIQRIIKA